jgi:hypothetical protein
MEPGASRNARLSPRQLQIVKIIVEDLCSKQIAAGLGISTKLLLPSSLRSSGGLASRYDRNCSLGDPEWRHRSVATQGQL